MRRVLVGLWIFGLLAGCGKGRPNADRRLELYANARLEKAAEDLAGRWTKTKALPVVVQPMCPFAVARNPDEAAEADVVLGTEQPDLKILQAAGLVQDSKVIATDRAVLIVPLHNPAQVKAYRDLDRPGVKIGTTRPETSARLLFEALVRRLHLDRATKQVAREAKDADELIRDVAQGAVDVAVIWNSVAQQHTGKIRILPPSGPAMANERVVVILTKRGREKSAARELFAELQAMDARQVLQRYHLVPTKD